jgi:DNA-binding NtrC family response regulator
MPIHHTLLLDPNFERRNSIADALKTMPLDLLQVADFESALTEITRNPCEWLLVSDEIPLDQFRELKRQSVRLGPQETASTLFLAQSEQSASCGLRAGASDYLLTSELEPERLRLAHDQAENNLLSARRATQIQSAMSEFQVGKSPAFEAVRQLARKLAHSSAAVLIQGESGSGKSTLAYRLHQQSDRGQEPVYELDCRVVPSEQIEPMIFGNETSKPSGYPYCQHGLLELADGFGTVLLKEVHLLSESIQEKLLIYLQNHNFSRKGGTETHYSRARILATSSASLLKSVQKGAFREDLFLILNALALPLPPLRERIADIVPLAETFLKESSRSQGKNILALSPKCRPLLEQHDWPGNVSELKQVITRAAILCPEGALIKPEHLFPTPPLEDMSREILLDTPEDLASIERIHIFEILKKCQDNRTHAARRLGISIRTLRNKLREYRMTSQAA